MRRNAGEYTNYSVPLAGITLRLTQQLGQICPYRQHVGPLALRRRGPQLDERMRGDQLHITPPKRQQFTSPQPGRHEDLVPEPVMVWNCIEQPRQFFS